MRKKRLTRPLGSRDPSNNVGGGEGVEEEENGFATLVTLNEQPQKTHFQKTKTTGGGKLRPAGA